MTTNVLTSWAEESVAKVKGKEIWRNSEFGVVLMRQHRAGASDESQRFAVVYGKQIDQHLKYSDACAKLGQAILHAVACEGLIN